MNIEVTAEEDDKKNQSLQFIFKDLQSNSTVFKQIKQKHISFEESKT